MDSALMARNASVPEISTRRMIELYTPGSQIKAKKHMIQHQKGQEKEFSEMVREAYKPRISRRKVEEMQELVAKTTANKPKRYGE